MLKYNRILLKLSGEALAGNKEFGFSSDVLQSFARQVKEVHDKGVEVAIVIGGGNIFRGVSGMQEGFDRVTGDTMGMLATIMNGLALQDAIERLDIDCHSDASGCRTFYKKKGYKTSGKEKSSYFCRWYRKSLFHN